VNKRRTRKQTI